MKIVTRSTPARHVFCGVMPTIPSTESRMPPKLRNAWENIRASLWFVPAIFVLGAIGLAQLLLWLDSRFGANAHEIIPWYVADNADAARAILAVTAGSLVTVISIAYSITILAIQQ